MPRERSLAERSAQLDRIKTVLRQDPYLSQSQLMERFSGCKDQITKARKQLREEGVQLPDPRKIKEFCY
jgi:biotin operon repressor